MNIFALDSDPYKAARMMCDKHIPKMIVETAQMMASALIRHGATPDMMPLTKKGTPYKGGYNYHPCSVWASVSKPNFLWLAHHGNGLLDEYFTRYNKSHACEEPIKQMTEMFGIIPDGALTAFAQAMPDEFKNSFFDAHDIMASIHAYRAYYHSKGFAKWEKGTPAPWWWGHPFYACVADYL